MAIQEQEVFTLAEVAKLLKVSPDTISRRLEKEPGVIWDRPNAFTRDATGR